MESPSLTRFNDKNVRSGDPNILHLISFVRGMSDMYCDTHVYMCSDMTLHTRIFWIECAYVSWQRHMYCDIHTCVLTSQLYILTRMYICILIWQCTHIHVLTCHECTHVSWQWHMYCDIHTCVLRVICIFCVLICIRTYQICILTNTNHERVQYRICCDT